MQVLRLLVPRAQHERGLLYYVAKPFDLSISVRPELVEGREDNITTIKY